MRAEILLLNIRTPSHAWKSRGVRLIARLNDSKFWSRRVMIARHLFSYAEACNDGNRWKFRKIYFVIFWTFLNSAEWFYVEMSLKFQHFLSLRVLPGDWKLLGIKIFPQGPQSEALSMLFYIILDIHWRPKNLVWKFFQGQILILPDY